MSTDFDTFCESKFGGVFVESMLGVRGCLVEDDCIAPLDVEGMCAWEVTKPLCDPCGDGWSEFTCVGCATTTAGICRQWQRTEEEAGTPFVHYEWFPYWRCNVAGWSFQIGDGSCGEYYVDRFWDSALLEQGWCRITNALVARTTRAMCDDLGGEYHDPYPSRPDWEPALPCCVYTPEGTRCFEWSADECATQGGVEHGAIGATCDGVSCASPNFWGACCHGDGTCEDRIYPDDCHAQPGAVWHPCQTCDVIACEEGACCLLNGICEDGLTSPGCYAVGGLFQGPGTTCADHSIECHDRRTTPCCIPDHVCIDVPARNQLTSVQFCRALDGIPMGAPTCADVSSCPERWGACCKDFGEFDAQCHMVHGDAVQMDCTDFGGTYMGHGTRCSELNCAEGVGACCKPSGICLGPPNWPSMTRPACEYIDPDNVFIGYGKTCTEVTCVGSLGACCSIRGHGLCNVVPEQSCDSNYGIWQGVGTTCESVLCPETIGACCALTGRCYLTWRGQCDFYQGIGAFQGVGTTCGDVDCGPDSSCCLPDGSCVTTGLMDCRERGGAWNKQPPGWPPWGCGDTSCNSGVGACCKSERCWDDTPYDQCIEDGGKFFGDGSVCGQGARQDCTPGACCLPNGTCEYWTQAWCENRGGEWRGDYGDYFPKCRDEHQHPYDIDCSEPA